MGRLIAGGLLAAIVLYFWNFLAWTVLPWHQATLTQIENEDAVRTALQTNVSEDGVYFIPGMSEAVPPEEWTARHQEGPLAFLVYYHDGREPMEPMLFASGFIIYLVSGFLGAGLLWSARAALPSYLSRVVFVTAIGVLIAVYAFFSDWNWLYFPTDYTLGLVADAVIAWFIAGLLLGALIKPAALAPQAATV